MYATRRAWSTNDETTQVPVCTHQVKKLKREYAPVTSRLKRNTKECLGLGGKRRERSVTSLKLPPHASPAPGGPNFVIRLYVSKSNLPRFGKESTDLATFWPTRVSMWRKSDFFRWIFFCSDHGLGPVRRPVDILRRASWHAINSPRDLLLRKKVQLYYLVISVM